MISKRYAKQFCKEYWKIENYSDAVNDLSQTWHCHHRREISEQKSMKQLIDEGLYYDVSPEELIFLTKAEHLSLHHKGKQLSAEHKQRLSEINKGKHHSAETKRKLSKASKESEYHKSIMKQVQCLETGEVFESVSEAARKYNLNYSHISSCCNGKRKTTGKLHWCFV